MWRELLQIVMQLLGHVFEIDHGIDVECGLSLFGEDMLVDIFLEAPSEFRDVLNLHGETDGISMSAEILQQVATVLNSVIDIVSGNTSGRACSQTVEFGEHHRRTVIEFCQA